MATSSSSTVYAPTVKPYVHFNVREDCDALRSAMRGLGTDEDALINILCRRSQQQRLEIKRIYQETLGRDLVKDISSETSGNFRSVLKRLLRSPSEHAACELRKAIAGLGTDEDALIEVICTKSAVELGAISVEYKELFGSRLDKDIGEDTSGYFRRFLNSMLNANRPSGLKVNSKGVRKDARLLADVLNIQETTNNSGMLNRMTKSWEMDTHDFLKIKVENSSLLSDKARAVIGAFAFDNGRELKSLEDCLNSFLCSRSNAQLQATFEALAKDYGQNILEVVKNRLSGDYRDAIQTTISVSYNQAQQFYAKRIFHATNGSGTRDATLIRIITSRCDLDLAAIMKEFMCLYGKSLVQVVKDKTSGDYRKAILTLIGG